MYKIVLYEDRRGRSDVREFIKDLRLKSYSNKDARINFNKVVAYIDLLTEYGTRIGEPVVKHLDEKIWELRPLANRILFACDEGDELVLLHQFRKKSNKTPRSEIEKAKREIEDYRRRQKNDIME